MDQYLYESQVELYAAMETLYTNMKKDGKERKANINYFTRKLEILESYWSEYQGNHKQLLSLEDRNLSYFQEKYWEKAEVLYQKIKEYINKSMEEQHSKSPCHDQQTPGTSKEYKSPSLAVEQPQASRESNYQGQEREVSRSQSTHYQEQTGSNKSQGSTSKSDDMLHMQNVNFKAFMRTIRGIKLEEISEKWEFEDILTQLQDRWKVIDTQHWKIQAEIDGENEDYEQSFTYHENMYNRFKRNINSKLWSVSHREKSTPQVEIPIFTGNYHQWVSFKDLFKETIHLNPSLSKAQKMQFLKSKIKGEAERLIQHLSISSENYDSCWEILNHRYDNKKLIFTSHLNMLMNLPTSTYQSLVYIRKMHDVTLETLNAIKNLGVDISTWDPIIVHILSQKLDAESYSEYLDTLKNSRELPILNDFISYLESKFTALEQARKPHNVDQKRNYSQQNDQNVASRRSINYNHNYYHSSPTKPVMRSLHVSSNQASSTKKCPICNLDHGLFYCKKFLSMPNDEKLKTITKNRICKNCLYPHFGKACISNKRCRICSFGNHNTLLHDACTQQQPTYNKSKQFNVNNPTKPQNMTNVSHVSQKDVSQVLLSTAIIKVKTHDGSFMKMRALIDQGSQISLITERGAQSLGIKRQHCQGIFFGVGERENNCKGMLNINCQSIYNEFSFQTEVFITNKLITNLPNISFEKPTWDYIQNINLADPEFYNSRPIDLLFGADIYSNIMLGGILRGTDPSLPLAQQTQLGWLLCGNMKSYHCNVILSNIENIQKFWEVEDISESAVLSEEDQKCINHYIKTTKRREDGRYQVELPFKENFEQNLGKSKEKAIAQFRSMERKMSQDPALSADYKSFIKEYRLLGHMIPAIQSSESDCYLPHHAVHRADSATSKIRVVFNASQKTSSSASLNDVMYKGPNLQQDLQSLLIKWRQYQYAYTADIEKMYRQILISEHHQKYQKIVWRDSVTQPIQEYQLTTITYGTKAAPFLAMMTLKQLAADERINYPDVAKIVEQSFYMDDLVHGSHSIKEGKQQILQLCNLLKSGGFTLRKWSCNENQLLQPIMENQNNDNILFYFKSESTGKTLGLRWNSLQDKFTFECNMTPMAKTIITKRVLLSEISKLFDPIGWLVPIATTLKLLFQTIWMECSSWDDVIPSKAKTEWMKIRADLENISQIEIERWVGSSRDDIIEFHGFCDASLKAYAAAIYVRIKKDSRYHVTLLTAKSKVVPIKKKISLPRLELCGAQLLAKLMNKVIECYQESYQIKVHGWSDSMVVLGWLQGETTRWQPFVANRVKQIKDIISSENWSYVKTKENPADIASRGTNISQLKDHKSWWSGPEWLQSLSMDEINKNQNHFTTNHERKIVQTNIIQKNTSVDIITQLLQKHNSFIKICRILAWIQRALTRNPKRSLTCKPTYITLQEIKQSKLKIIKYVQHSEFASDMENLQKFNKLNNKSNLWNLSPFIDQDGVLRVGGRLQKASLSYEMKHPIIIPHNHRLTQLLITEAHMLTYHGGPRLTLSILRRKYWVIGGNRATKKELRNCIICRKNNPEIQYQHMGDLPSSRTDPAPPFYHTGVDYTGFVDVKANKGRGIKTTKGYIAVFICMVTKAVHLEIVSDLSSAAFLSALRRMAARKSTPHHIYSDCGSNFIKANRIIQEEYQELEKVFNDQFYQEITSMNITWHFNAPAWPSAGGLWERAVRSLKYHLKRTIGEQKLTFEEYSTLLAEIEACLNSRPLCSISEDVEDLDFLTPAHFLSGRADLTIIETDHDARTRWHLISKLKQDIWKRWKTEYLSQLSVRSKWLKRQKNIQIGDVVVIKDDNLPTGKWAMGRVTEVHPGQDGLIRVVTLKTKNGFIKRPVAKLSILPLHPSKEQSVLQESKENKDQSNRKNPVGMSKYSKFISTALTCFILFMTIISPANASYHITKFNNNQSVYFDSISELQIIRDEWTMVVYYNMSPYWEGMTTINKFNNYLEKSCERFQEQTQCHMILQQLRHENNELEYYNKLLLNQDFDAHARQRRGLINGIGYVANTLFGVLDERFAEKYTQDIQQIRVNQRHLSDLWKNQTSVVEAQYNLLKRTEDLIAKQHKIINKHLNTLYQSTDYIKEQIQSLSKIEEFTLSAITAINLINNLKRAQDTLLDTLTDIYHGKLNIHLITPEQLRSELLMISSHLSKDLTIPLKNIHGELLGIYHLLRVKARMTQEYFIFEIKFPLITRDNYQLYNLISIPHQIENNIIISITPLSDYIAINIQKDSYVPTTYLELQDCLNHELRYLCKLKNPVRHLSANEKFCEIDKTNNNCKIQKKPCENKLVQLLNVYSYLYFYCYPCSWRIICEDDVSNPKLNGAGIINLSEKCMVKGEDFSIFPHQPSRNTIHINPKIMHPEIPSINYLLNLSFPNISNDSSEGTTINEDLNHIQTQIQLMKKNADLAESDISAHDVHQYIISYGLLAAAVALGGLVWWRRRRRTRVSPSPAPAPGPANVSDGKVNVSDSEVSVSDSEVKVKGSYKCEHNIEMVDMATSPIQKKCVRFCKE